MNADDKAHDKYDICETVYRFAWGVDTRDWALYRSIFADELRVDYSSFGGYAPAVQRADDWVAGVAPLFNGFAATQHSMSNALVDLDGDRAHCRMYVWAHHVFEPDDPASWFTVGGYYDDDLVRSSEGPVGWLITSVKLTATWRAGDQAIMSPGRTRGDVGRG